MRPKIFMLKCYLAVHLRIENEGVRTELERIKSSEMPSITSTLEPMKGETNHVTIWGAILGDV